MRYSNRRSDAEAIDDQALLPCSYDAAMAENAVKFEMAHLFLTLVVLGPLLALFHFSKAPPAWLWLCFMAGLRLLALFGRRLLPFRRHVLFALLLLLDVSIVVSCKPIVWKAVGLGTPDIAPTESEIPNWIAERNKKGGRKARQAAFATPVISCSIQDLQDLRQLVVRERHSFYLETVIMEYALHLLIWYKVIFVLLFRHVRWAAPLSYCIFLLSYFGLGETRPAIAPAPIVLLGSIVIVVFAKYRLETSQRYMFDIIEEGRLRTIQERVLRFKAEFTNDEKSRYWPKQPSTGLSSFLLPFRDAKAASPPPAMLGAVADDRQEEMARQGKKAPSVRSAPAVVHDTCTTAGLAGGERSAGKCLPPEVLVWVEGHPVPRAVGTVSVGERVLCFDNLANGLRYVEVTDMKTLGGSTQFVFVELVDGTVLKLTADHPMRPLRNVITGHPIPKRLGSKAHVHAANLKAGIDSLMVFKMVPLEVKRVSPACSAARHDQEDEVVVQSDGEACTRVSLKLHQPDRHEVFVATDQRNSDGTRIAVGSSDALVIRPSEVGSQDSFLLPNNLTVKRTFLDVDVKLKPGTKRASSAPPAFCSSTAIASVDVVDTVIVDRWHSCSDSELTSEQNSRRSRFSGDSGEVVIGAADASGIVRVSEVMDLRIKDLKSLGSLSHGEGKCKVCIFAKRQQYNPSGEGCWMGAFCGRCHEAHDDIVKKKMSGGMRRIRRALRGDGGNTVTAPREHQAEYLPVSI
eukprot:TRINITY_DN34070_c0_g1_i1.p1 TRINITY_DN34070_c0_g1~~TRINITY_DN34070_c0_g1_i1.p1  ORF type:complete len:744 (-),score=98.37 TRINITY_DN34070_c0_g1_i1:169-2400(-)